MQKDGTGAAGRLEQTIHMPITLPVSLRTGHDVILFLFPSSPSQLCMSM